jgi:hypothetical protein
MNNKINSDDLKGIKTIKDAVIYYIKYFEIDMIESLLDDKKTYQDFPKFIFIQKLGNALHRFMKSGDNYLLTYKGKCNSEICSIGCEGIRFIGQKSKLYMDLVFKIENESLIDIYECHQFKCLSPSVDFESKVFIDTKDLPTSLM